MRLIPLAALLATIAQPGFAETATIAAPKPHVANYDPTLSAKEAVLANWELAASGIRAGQIVGRQVVSLAGRDLPCATLTRQAVQAQKTMVLRFNSALWVSAAPDNVTQVDGTVLRAAAATAEIDCAAAGNDVLSQIEAAFVEASEDMGTASADVFAAIEERQELPDSVLMTEQLTMIADYLESGDWGTGLHLTELGRDGEEVSARIVGTMALWHNIEPYVGLTSPEIDDAINAAVVPLLKAVRFTARELEVLDPNGPEMADLTAKANALAAEFRRAAALFAA